MKVELSTGQVRFSQIIPGHGFLDHNGVPLMRIKQRDGDKNDAVNLHTGEVIRYVNTNALVTPLKLKVVEEDPS